jgi:two-component system NtrC family sensor kinase
MNPAAGELFGYPSLQETPGITVDRLYRQGEAQKIMKKLRSESLGGVGKLSSIETTIVDAKGEEIPVDLTASIVYEQEEEVATVGIYTDLREKLAVEQQLKEALTRLAQSEKMASMGRLAAGVAHEINNPLTGILFNASMMLESLTGEDPMHADLEEVLEDVYRCRDIVQNLLAYSRQTSPTNSIIELNALVNHSLALIRDQSLFHNITIAREMADNLMLVHVDKNQIGQVIINLIMNAIDAMDGKGRLTLRTRQDTLEDKVSLEVEDTGCGIPIENMAKIFDPFFTTKTLGKGTGLGLSTAYGIVKENNGEIRVKTTGATGTTFQLLFPAFHASDTKAALEADQLKSAGIPPEENGEK